MPNIHYEIETIIGDDNRLNEIPVKVIIKNQSESRIKVKSIVPNIPNSVDLEEKIDAFQEDSKKQTNALCEELTLIANNVLLLSNKEHRINLVNTMKEVYTDFYSSIPNLYKLMFLNQSAFKARISFFNKQLSKLKFQIQNIEDANWAYEKFIKDLDEVNPDKKLYEGKLRQLENLYSRYC